MLAALAASLALGAAPAPRVRAIAPRTLVEWSNAAAPARFTASGVTVAVRVRRNDDIVTPVFTITAPGRRPLTIEGEESGTIYSSFIAIGPLERGQPPSVMLETYSGGAHCCVSVQVVLPEGKGWNPIVLGEWNGDRVAFPRDVSGDGVADFVVRDNTFYYAFGSYTESYPAPVVLNIRGGRVVDVSAEPAFAPLFRADLAETRAGCVPAGPDDTPSNAMCAAYAADAARLGEFDTAWRAVMAAYDRTATDWPDSCRLSAPPDPCYSDYPAALKAFLRRGGYIR
jgi:hypothetical protein